MARGEQSSRPRFGRGRGSAIAAGIVLASIAVGGIILAAVNMVGTGTQPALTSTPTVGPAVTSTAIAEADKSICGLPGYSASGTLDALPVTDWEFLGTISIPSSALAGPGVVDADGYRSCFAHTVDGAVVAAATFIAEGSMGTLRTKMVENAVAPGPGRDATLQRLSYGSAGTATDRITIQGVRVLSYTGSTATVDIALASDKGVMFSDVFQLVWLEGDWKIVLDPSGNPPNPPAQISTLQGYLLWGAP